ncbi:hypothetical protein LXL04_002164 [Taraxacum kok-saghyz]
MSSKTLIRNGVSLMTRIMNPAVHHNPAQKFVPQLFEIAPKLSIPPPFPSLLKLHNPLNLVQNEAETVNRVSVEEFLYPCGLPSLEFFLPDGDESSSSEPLLCIKRTYQPSNLRRKRVHGYLASKVVETYAGKQQKEEDELLLGELQRVGSESQPKKGHD